MIENAVFLDVDNTLLLTEINKDGSKTQVINEHLLSQLQEMGQLDLYLFTNIDFNELNSLNDPQKISLKTLVAELHRLGFTVQAVVTPADIYYENKNPGAAYTELYLTACEKKEQGNDYSNEAKTFTSLMEQIVVNKIYNIEALRAIGRKKLMFDYFFKHITSLNNILYLANEYAALKALKDILHPLINLNAIRYTSGFYIKENDNFAWNEIRDKNYPHVSVHTPNFADKNPISSVFLLDILSSKQIKIIAGILLIAGLAALTIGTLGCAGVIAAFAGAATLFVMSAGGAACISGISLGALGFFSTKPAQKETENTFTCQSNSSNPVA